MGKGQASGSKDDAGAGAGAGAGRAAPELTAEDGGDPAECDAAVPEGGRAARLRGRPES